MQPDRVKQGSLRSGSRGRGARARALDDPGSPAPWLVLALVIEQPSHGYELSRRYAQRFASLVALSVPRLYAALDRLRDAGLIEPIVLKSVQPTPKQHQLRRSYRATRAGVREYRRWVAEQMRDDPQRSQLLARIASVNRLCADAVLDVIDQYDTACLEELRALPAGSERLEMGTASLDEVAESLLVDQQRRELRASHEWALHARKMIDAYRRRARGRRPGGRRA